MSLRERYIPKDCDREKPFFTDEVHSLILLIGSEWKEEGTPWWTESQMRKRFECNFEGEISENLGIKIEELDENGFFYSVMGGEDAGRPQKVIPQIGNLKEMRRYYQVKDQE